MKLSALAPLAALPFFLFTISTGFAQEAAHAITPSISVTGQATLSATPDSAEITFSIETYAVSANAAMSDNATIATNVIEAIKTMDIEANNIKTSSITLNPNYERQRDNNIARITGYTARNTLHIKITEIEKTGALIDAAIQNGANRIQSLNFDVSNRDELLLQAKQQAMRNAIQQADNILSVTGAKRLKILTISAGHTNFQPPQIRFARAQMEAANFETPIETGQIQIHATINATFEILE